MAKGITETEVHQAADELVSAGERPTVERIRGHLGTGSPNTVTRWLESWWGTLGERLAAQATKAALPAAPDAVVALATQWWEQALTAARAEAERALADERSRLEVARAELDEQAREAQAQVAHHVAIAERARQLQAAAEQRFADVQRTCDLQSEQLRDLGAQRDAGYLRAERLDAALSALQARAAERELALTREREAQAQHVRGIEDRAHAEIDRARQELKVARTECATQLQRLTAEVASGRERENQARQALGVAQQDAVAQYARATALEQQLARAGRAPTAARRDAARATKPASRRARPKAP